MIESFVDLTYRGLSLGKRIKLGQVRPHSGHLELATPMPVGSQIAIVTDDGLTIDATVTWVYEQVAGTDRAPGMIVAPALTDVTTAWWQARIALPEDDGPRPRITRTRPTTIRPRTQTLQTPPPDGAVSEGPTAAAAAAADLAARVAAAAGVAPPRPATSAPITPAGEPVLPPPAGDPGMRSTGEHNVIDDGNKTVIMQAIDPADVEATLDTGAEPQTSDTSETSETSDPSDASDDGDDEPAEPPPTEASAPAKASGKKRKRRR